MIGSDALSSTRRQRRTGHRATKPLQTHTMIGSDVGGRMQRKASGMLIDQAAIERVERYVAMGKEQGELLFGGTRPSADEYAKGCPRVGDRLVKMS